MHKPSSDLNLSSLRPETPFGDKVRFSKQVQPLHLVLIEVLTTKYDHSRFVK